MSLISHLVDVSFGEAWAAGPRAGSAARQSSTTVVGSKYPKNTINSSRRNCISRLASTSVNPFLSDQLLSHA